MAQNDDLTQVSRRTSGGLDALDVRILRLLLEQPRAGVREYARLLGVARGTVQSRLDRLERSGVVADHQPTLAPEAMGFTGLAYVRLDLSQGSLEAACAALAGIPEVVQADSVAGDADLVLQVVSTGPEDLEDIIQRIVAVPGVERSRTEPVLRRRIPRRVAPLLDRLGRA